MTDLIFRVDGDVLVPNSHDSRMAVRGWLQDQLVVVRPHAGKREAMIRLVHVLCKKGADNASAHVLVEQVKARAMAALGFWRSADFDPATGALVRLERMSLTELSDEELSDFIERLKDWIVTELCPGMDPKLLEREAGAATGVRR